MPPQVKLLAKLQSQTPRFRAQNNSPFPGTLRPPQVSKLSVACCVALLRNILLLRTVVTLNIKAGKRG